MSETASDLTARLAAKVADYIRQGRLARGDHLTEQQLADAYNVSRTPVRGALAMLERAGVVEREPHRGYFVKKIPTASALSALPKPTDPAEDRYLRIADDRLAGRLPDHVTETALMHRYGVPRRELQRMLHRMEKEGWIERKPGHGWMFVALPDTMEAHAQSYRFRMLFEPGALLEPGFRIDKAELARIRRDQQMLLDGGVRRLSRAKLFEMGSDFHETLMSFSGNRFVIDAIRRVNAMRRLLEYRAHSDRERFASQCREHLHLLDLLEHGSRAEAADYLRRHLDVVRAIKTMPKATTPRGTLPPPAHM
ncbi:MAG TPA: GntR family transcriptional regulator [Burkholderiales bacterium]|nr:GntR family transcriptional regulator [Burkholderiales bacterium]